MNVFRPPCDEAVIRSRPADAPCPEGAKAAVLAATILGSSMAFIDGTVVNIALPVLQGEFGASVAGAQWVVQAYSLVLASLLLTGGALGDRLGRRRVFVAGILLFTATSIAAGISQSLPQLVAARALQGIGGALLTPGSLAIISASFAGEERGRAIGTWSSFTSLTAAAGPVLGGLLIAAGSWRYVFFVNVPIAVFALWFTRSVPESGGGSGLKGIDWGGAVLATLGLGGIVYGLVTASAAGFGQLDVVVALAGGVVFVVLFVLVERSVANPMLPLQLFQSRTFTGANLLTFLLYGALGGALFFFPFNLIQIQGYSPTAAGAALLPFIVLMFLLSRFSGALAARYSRLMLIGGPVVAALGLALFALPGVGGSYWTTFFPAVIVLGLGMAATAAPLTNTVMGAVDQGHSGTASGINNAVSRTAGVVALAALAIVAAVVFNISLANRMAGMRLSPDMQRAMDAQSTKLAAAQMPPGLDATTSSQLQRAIDDSFVTGFRVVMLVAAGVALGASACAAVTIGKSAPNPREGPSGTAGGGATAPG